MRASDCVLPRAYRPYCLLLTACCLLLTAYCLLLTAYCLLPTAYCLLLTAYCLLLTASFFAISLLGLDAFDFREFAGGFVLAPQLLIASSQLVVRL